MLFLCMDANFRLKNQLVSNYSQDPRLGTGWAYVLPREGYEGYVLSRASNGDVSFFNYFILRLITLISFQISTCVRLQALAKMNTKFLKGLRYTGVGGVMCGWSEMVMPLGIGNLQKGERCVLLFQTPMIARPNVSYRYCNMDYIFAVILYTFLIYAYSLCLVIISYDIACQWFVNIFTRMDEHWPATLRIPSSIKLIPAIPKLHKPMHGHKNYQ